MSAEPDFYKEVLDSLYDGVYFVDRDRTITYRAGVPGGARRQADVSEQVRRAEPHFHQSSPGLIVWETWPCQASAGCPGR